MIMVSSTLIDTVSNPTKTLMSLYDSNNDIDAFPSLVSRHFSSIFDAPDAFDEIPVLDTSHPPSLYAANRRLVQFRAMVQDTSMSPEMYLSRFSDQSNKCGGWGISIDPSTANALNMGTVNYSDLRECTVIWAVSIPGESNWCTKQLNGASTVGEADDYRPSQSHKFPIPSGSHVGVQVKIYNSQLSNLKSTDLVTFIGILTSEPIHSEMETENALEVPTLHVLFTRPIPSTLVKRSYPAMNINESIREQLISWIADEGLGGDRHAAEWVLLTMIARVHSRTPSILPPTLTLARFPQPPTNISVEVPSSRTPTLAHILQTLFPIFVFLPLSLESLNAVSFDPQSKMEDLHAGWLQLPAGANILVMESGITEGTVNERGLTNLRSLQSVMKDQTLEYEFPFSRFSFPTDMSFIILTEGSKSTFFQTDVVLSLHADTFISGRDAYKPLSQIRLPNPETLEGFRQLVGGAKSHVGRVNIGPDISAYIQNDFVQERQKNSAINSDELIHRMTVARLLALSLHVEEMSVGIWERAKALDAQRKIQV